jgi:hypothetical protein
LFVFAFWPHNVDHVLEGISLVHWSICSNWVDVIFERVLMARELWHDSGQAMDRSLLQAKIEQSRSTTEIAYVASSYYLVLA